MKRTILEFIQAGRRFFWWLTRPTTVGVRGLVINGSGQVMLIRHTYQSGWYLPGGKVGRSEAIIDGLHRELSEEVGLTFESATMLAVYSSSKEYKHDHIAVFIIRDWKQKENSHFEIESVAFWDPKSLPDGCSPATNRRIQEYLGKAKITYYW